MNTKQLRLVSYSQAVALRKLGFDWETQSRYLVRALKNGKEKITLSSPNLVDWNTRSDLYGFDFTSAPTVALALKWIRDEKGFYLGVLPHSSESSYYGVSGSSDTTERYDTYEAAENALLDELLTVLENGRHNEI
jgi:hypothetical protein